MKSFYRKFFLFTAWIICIAHSMHAQPDSGKIRVIMFGAHPDDCDEKSGVTASLYAQIGYAVKFVAVTNGDAGHQT